MRNGIMSRVFVEWQQKSRMDGRGGRWGDARQVLNGVLWILAHRGTVEGLAGSL